MDGLAHSRAKVLNADGKKSHDEMMTDGEMTNHEELVTDDLIVDGKRSHGGLVTANGADGKRSRDEMVTCERTDRMVTYETTAVERVTCETTAVERVTLKCPGSRVWEGPRPETLTLRAPVRSCDNVAACRARLGGPEGP